MDNKTLKKIITFVAVCLVFEAVSFVAAGYYIGSKEHTISFQMSAGLPKVGEIKKAIEKEEAKIAAAEKLKAEKQKKKEAAFLKEKEIAEYKVPDLAPLKKDIEEIFNDKEGYWSLYLKILRDDEPHISISNQSQRSASLIKLYVAGAYLKGVEDGYVDDTYENQDYLHRMISESDNDAWMQLESVLGDEYHSRGTYVVNDFIYEEGYRSTDRDSSSDRGNITSVENVGRVLEEIYKGKYVSKKASDTILGYMKEQTHRAKIPAGLPDEVKVANKTGELETVENDAAIVWTDKCDYILVVMASKVNDEDLGVPIIRDISKMVYEYLMNDQKI